MAFLIGAANSAVSGVYDVANSCRFDGSSTNLLRTNSNETTTKITFSVWVKRGALGGIQRLFAADGNDYMVFRFESSNALRFFINIYGVAESTITTNRLFRDVSAWYHLVVTWDSTQSTAADRIKLWVNGTQETSFSASNYPAEDQTTTAINNTSANAFNIGRYQQNDNEHFNGYMAEAVIATSQALAPTDFGEFDEDSPTIWKPKDVSGLTFGTNGFYLDFEASDNLGNDANGGTDFTETNLAATDQCTDTPTNNFCTLNPLTKLGDATLSEANTSVTYGTSSGRRPVFGTFAVSTGKWYFEMKCIATSQTVTEASFGFSNTFDPAAIGVDVHTNNGFAVAYRSTDQSIYTGTTAAVTSLGDMGVNDLFACVLDLDSGTQTLKIQKGGDESWNTASLASQTAGDNYPYWTPIVACSSDAQTFTLALNFGNPSYSLSSAVADANGYGAFEYAPPSGYFALCTKNLAEYG